MKNLLLSILCVLLFTGCTTIHFDKGAQVDAKSTVELQHHNFVFSLYEASDSVDLKKECGDSSWSSVQTEVSFLNGLSSGIVNSLGPIWYPKTVVITCG